MAQATDKIRLFVDAGFGVGASPMTVLSLWQAVLGDRA